MWVEGYMETEDGGGAPVSLRRLRSTVFLSESPRSPSLASLFLLLIAVTSFLMARLLFASPSEISCGEDWNLPRCEERRLR